jgi:phage terminase large subunit
MGAVTMRIEAARRLFHKCWFDESRTETGRDALGFYHETKDDNRDIGLGPEHDWSSHAADAFGLMCVAYRDPAELAAFYRPIIYPRMSVA